MKRSVNQSLDTSSKKKMKYSDVDDEKQEDAPAITMDSLPREFFHLGGDVFAVVSCYIGITRVHIRRYRTNDCGELFPTKQGVSISPAVWETLSDRLNIFMNGMSDGCMIISRDLCLNKLENDKISFQRLFKKKDNSLCFLPECVVLTTCEATKLYERADSITLQVKNTLLQSSLRHFVHLELKKYPDPDSSEYCDPDCPDGWTETKNSVCELLKNSIASYINKHFMCFCGDETSGHDCLKFTYEYKFKECYQSAFYCIDWRSVAHEFVKKNHQRSYLNTLIYLCGFFECLEINDILEIVKNMYIKDDPHY